MYTRCPFCRTTFRIRPDQLRMANGKARCSHCKQIFNALSDLHDLPPGTITGVHAVSGSDSSAKKSPAKQDVHPESLNEFIYDKTDSDSFFVEDYDPSGKLLKEVKQQLRQQQARASMDPDEATAHHDEPDESKADHDEQAILKAYQQDDEQAILQAYQQNAIFDDIEESTAEETPAYQEESSDVYMVPATPVTPEEASSQDEPFEDASSQFSFELSANAPPLDIGTPLQDADGSLPPATRLAGDKRHGLLWGLLAFLLLLVLLFQLFLQYKDQLGQNPSTAQQAAQLCQLIGCKIRQKRALDQFQILRRQVVASEEQPDQLLFSVTFRNNADFAQPYPAIGLLLYTHTDQAAGQRLFQPADYLEKSDNSTPMLPAGQTVSVDLRIAAKNLQLDGFRFDFY
ncbi:MAG: DUF3426 domain-containing protein [gamma proteobacterium symbiont of Bathyaustriella thionipta]|nr:DUF3426 domain-containing protein [gamma proteobacterium symbiont of Bathyaustriella thionipta]